MLAFLLLFQEVTVEYKKDDTTSHQERSYTYREYPYDHQALFFWWLKLKCRRRRAY